MARLPIVRPRQVVAALGRAGFSVHHHTGSHAILRHDEDPTRRVTVPMHSRELVVGCVLVAGRRPLDPLRGRPPLFQQARGEPPTGSGRLDAWGKHAIDVLGPHRDLRVEQVLRSGEAADYDELIAAVVRYGACHARQHGGG